MITNILLERVTEGGQPNGLGRLILLARDEGCEYRYILDIVEFEQRWAQIGVDTLCARHGRLPGRITYGSHEYEPDCMGLGDAVESLLGSDPDDLDRDRETEAQRGAHI